MCTSPAGYFKQPSFGILFSALSNLKNEYVGVDVVLLYQRRGQVSSPNICTQRPLSISKTRTKLDGVLTVFVPHLKFRGLFLLLFDEQGHMRDLLR